MATTSLPEKSHAETLLQDSALSKLPAAFSVVMVGPGEGARERRHHSEPQPACQQSHTRKLCLKLLCFSIDEGLSIYGKPRDQA